MVAATCTALVPLLAHGFGTVVLLRLLTGTTLAGVYPVGMKLMAPWTTPARRGTALGFLVGALTLGSAMPQLIKGLEGLSWQAVMVASAVVTLTGGLVALTLIRPGPTLQTAATRFDARYAFRMFAQRAPRQANLGYLGHMWELYAIWTWLPTFVLMSQAQRGESTGSIVNVVAFLAIGVAGMLGCLVGGVMADRFGRARAAVIADSGVFSTALSETADPRYVGTALTAQTAFGFALTIVTIHLVPELADVVGWQWALTFLAVGPLAGAVAMSRWRQPA